MVTAFLAALFVPPATAFAASGEWPRTAQLKEAEESAAENDDSDSGEHAEDPEQNGTQSEAVKDSDDPGDHSDSADDTKDHGDEGPCTSVSSISICIDQPR
jgi:hypothetical protein